MRMKSPELLLVQPLGVQDEHALRLKFDKHCGFGTREQAVEALQHREEQDHATIFALLMLLS